MTLEERLNYCKICQNRKMDFNIGIVCKLTDKKPDFEPTCPDFAVDQEELTHYQNREEEVEESDGGTFAVEKKGIKKGMLGGIAMVVIAVVWFFGGLAAGYIFFYPPILFAIGVFAIIKGAVTGNIAGNKRN